jgi:steroid delta-isomerase-like uncharacterized protein
MSAEQNKATVRRLFDEVWSNGNLDVADELLADAYVFHDPMAPGIRGPEGFKRMVAMYRAGYPDLRFTVEDQLAEGDKVATRWSCEGTHRGELLGIPATGKRTNTSGIDIARFEEGKIVEDWSRWDALGWLQQLGVVPPIGKAEVPS